MLVADIVDPVRRGRCGRVGILLVPVRIALRDDVKDSNHSLNYVVDISEVMEHVAVVEHLYGPVVEYGINEKERRHIGASPWAVDGEEAQTGFRDTI